MINEQAKPFRLPNDQDDKLATEVSCNGWKLLPPEGFLIGKVTPVEGGMIVEFVEK